MYIYPLQPTQLHGKRLITGGSVTVSKNALELHLNPLQTAWNQTRRRVTRRGQVPSCLPLCQYVFHILSKLIEI